VAVDEQGVVPVDLADLANRRVQLGVVLRQVAGEVRRLVREQTPAVLAEIQCVEMPAALDVEVGQVRLEEVVHEAVHVEDRAAGWGVGGAMHQGGDHLALIVRVERDHVPFVRVTQDVNRHVIDVTRE
jgi:hypothetical protein